jgi:hypothetical protein
VHHEAYEVLRLGLERFRVSCPVVGTRWTSSPLSPSSSSCGMSDMCATMVCASRCRARWDQWQHVAAVAPNGWKESRGGPTSVEAVASQMQTVSHRACRSAWARVITKVHEADSLACARSGDRMDLIAAITDPPGVRKILRYLLKIDTTPPRLDSALVD